MVNIVSVTLNDAVIGLISATLVGGVLYLKESLQNKYLEYKYPVGGQYLTTFVDEINGEKTEIRAPAELDQSGRTISGYTEIPGDDREWVLEGKVSSNGYINGLYRAADPHDHGVGNFFLYINYDRKMEGLWSGYDEVNDKISSGRYKFVPLFDNFDIEPLNRSQIPTVMDIADSQLGKDYIAIDMLERALEADSVYFGQVAVTSPEDDQNVSRISRLLAQVFDRDSLQWRTKRTDTVAAGEIVGFCIGGVFSQEELRSYLLINPAQLPEGLKHAEKIGVVRTVAVREEYQGLGIGTDLVGRCIDECQARDCEAMSSVGWEANGQVNIGGIMERFGFSTVSRFEDYWHDHSLEQEYECQICGHPPCTCPAVVYASYK